MKKRKMNRQERFFKPGVRFYWLGFAAPRRIERWRVTKRIMAYSFWPIDMHIVRRTKK